MQDHAVEQLDKVLALADSSHEGEAVGAVRMARQMLSRDGLNFSDLARAASSRSRFTLPLSIFSGQQVHLESQIARLQQQVYDLQTEQQSQQTQIEFWRRRAMDLEQQLNLSISDAQRWRQLARDTVEKLWDAGQSIHKAEDAVATEDSMDDYRQVI
ncbi:MAG: hypothetical protein PHX43_02230 [Alphaproteobacteria bacterium]|nr:hypothetical protein [Alphaproteobacteria bacterium]